jgi:SH3-like domain-containing protein
MEQQRRADARRRAFKSAGLIAAAVFAGFLFYPQVAALLPRNLPMDLTAATTALSAAPAAPAPAAAPQQPTAMIARGVNLRAGPTTQSAVVSQLSRGLGVVTFENSGNWVRVRTVPADSTQPLEGWVYTSFLETAGSATATASAE